MKKRNLILAVVAAMVFGIFIGCIISNKVSTKANAEEIITDELEQVEKDTDQLYNIYDENPLEFYQKLVDILNIVQIYDSSELTLEMLQNRNGNIIIEKCIGEVVDEEGNGEILNYCNPEYYYINYSRVEGAKKGNIILTYFIYNPDTNAEDDILLRFDYIIDNKN